MSRAANEERPDELLDAIVRYLIKHGLADLSLRPLAKAVGSSPRVLLYYFGSKEKLIGRALAGLREGQRAMFSRMSPSTSGSPSKEYRPIWKQMTSRESEPFFRLFFEAYGLALRSPKRFKLLLQTAVEDWLEFVADPQLQKSHGRQDARAFATIVLAGFRGFMLDFCATRDRKRLDRAVDLWLRSLDTIHLNRSPKVKE